MASDDLIQTDVKIEVFPQRVNHLLDSPDGAVGLHTRSASDRLHEVARGLIGTRYSGTTGRPKETRPGPLRDSGSVESAGRANWRVIFRHPIAAIHHNGSIPHVIPEGGKANKTVKGVARVYLYNEILPWGPRYSAVSHPGTAPNPYLINAAEQIGLQASGSLMRGRTLSPIFRASNFF